MVSLHTDVDASIVTKMLRRETVGGIVHQEQCVSGLGDSFGLILPRFKQRFTFLHQSTGKLHPRRGEHEHRDGPLNFNASLFCVCYGVVSW